MERRGNDNHILIIIIIIHAKIKNVQEKKEQTGVFLAASAATN